MNSDYERYDRDPIADEVRRSLAAHAAQAPDGGLLAERIIHTAERDAAGTARPRRSAWRTWALPLIAAGSVGVVVTAVIAIQNYHPSASGPPVPGTSPTHTQTLSLGSTATPTPAPTSAAATVATMSIGLQSVRIWDLTFANGQGWALASADCLHLPGRCVALLHTTDGRAWATMAPTPFNLPDTSAGCLSPCVQNIRFATASTGYLYGPDGLLMTTDGGQSWKAQGGGALFLESLDGNVIRVTSTSGGCPGPCGVRVETSAIGSTHWVPSTGLPSSLSGAAFEFARGGGNAYLLARRNPAGGAGNATSTLYRSADDGASWSAAGEPCPQTRGEVDSYAVAGGGGNVVSVLCASRQAPQHWFVAVSSDGGRHFSPTPGTVPTATALLLTGDPTTVLVTANHGMARSGDGGRTWAAVPGIAGDISWVGFESPTVGRAVGNEGRTIWTTGDGGTTWTSVTFP